MVTVNVWSMSARSLGPPQADTYGATGSLTLTGMHWSTRTPHLKYYQYVEENRGLAVPNILGAWKRGNVTSYLRYVMNVSSHSRETWSPMETPKRPYPFGKKNTEVGNGFKHYRTSRL